jgi:hypothetical protein
MERNAELGITFRSSQSRSHTRGEMIPPKKRDSVRKSSIGSVRPSERTAGIFSATADIVDNQDSTSAPQFSNLNGLAEGWACRISSSRLASKRFAKAIAEAIGRVLAVNSG